MKLKIKNKEEMSIRLEKIIRSRTNSMLFTHFSVLFSLIKNIKSLMLNLIFKTSFNSLDCNIVVIEITVCLT